MSENLRNYTKAIYGFEHVLRLTSEKALARKSPCQGWTGKDVVEHAFQGVKMMQSFAATGAGPRSLPKVGADPLKTWTKLRDDVLTALDQPGVLHGTAKEPFGPDFGDMEIDGLLGFMGADLAVHTWDLARTAKVDERIDAGLAKATLAAWKALPEQVLRMEGMFAPAIKPAKGADAQTRMLNFLGRA